jgi:Domain of unknown function DUF302
MARPHGLMIFYRADQGAITSLSGRPKRCSLYLVGNPVIANEIIDIDLRAGFYAPFRVCVYDSGAPGGASIAFDRPSSFLALLGRPELDAIGSLLDQKIDAVVAALPPLAEDEEPGIELVARSIKLNGRRLPSRAICHFHSGSVTQITAASTDL